MEGDTSASSPWNYWIALWNYAFFESPCLSIWHPEMLLDVDKSIFSWWRKKKKDKTTNAIFLSRDNFLLLDDDCLCTSFFLYTSKFILISKNWPHAQFLIGESLD